MREKQFIDIFKWARDIDIKRLTKNIDIKGIKFVEVDKAVGERSESAAKDDWNEM